MKVGKLLFKMEILMRGGGGGREDKLKTPQSLELGLNSSRRWSPAGGKEELVIKSESSPAITSPTTSEAAASLS